MPILFGVILLDLIGFGIVIPILPFLSPELGARTSWISPYIIVAYAVGAGLCAPLWGRLSDRIGRKPVIMICLAGAALSYLMLGLSSALWMVSASRAFRRSDGGQRRGCLRHDGGYHHGRRIAPAGWGLIGAAFGLGLVLGPMLGGLLSGARPGFFLPCPDRGGRHVVAGDCRGGDLPARSR